MSRIGKRPIPIPKGVEVKVEGNTVSVKGPKGVLKRTLPEGIDVEVGDGEIRVKRPDDTRRSRAFHGLSRVLVNNMVVGVSEGFTKVLVVNGVGYRVDEKGKALVFHLGYSHPIEFPLPEGVSAKVERDKDLRVRLESHDKELLGLVAAKIRALRPPEPYKGKGIQYEDEEIIRKAGKAAAK